MAEDDDQRGTKFFVSPSSLPLSKDYISDWTEKVSSDIDYRPVHLYNSLLTREQSVLFAFAPSITDGVHRNENVVEIIPVFSTFSNFFKKKKKKIYKSHFM